MSILEKGKVKNGILRASLNNFSELFEFSQWFHSNLGQYYFRGQANENWELETTLERFEASLGPHKIQGTNTELLKEFKRLARGKGIFSQIDLNTDEDFYALGQHYGLPTPLLDWTESFYIALFFAFAEEFPTNVENVAIWAIQKSASEIMENYNKYANDDKSKKISMKFVDPLSDINPRLVSQSGVFLQKPSGVSIEELISKYCIKNSKNPLLAKITIPTKEREDIINNLFAMNINWSTIFPDLEGAARHAKMKLEMLDLKVSRMSSSALSIHVNKSIR